VGVDLLPEFIRNNYEVHEWKHACAVMHNDFPVEWQDVISVLTDFRWRRSWVSVGGGSKSKVAAWIDQALAMTMATRRTNS
jgi:hypothetical protein